MKKILVAAAVAAVFASASFAQLSEGLSLSGDAGAIWDVAVNNIKADEKDPTKDERRRPS